MIVLVSDTFRYAYLECNAYRWIGTEALDRFAARSVNFNRHYLSSFPTIPNRTDLFTGCYSFPFHNWQPLDPSVPVAEHHFRHGRLPASADLRHAAHDVGCPPLQPRI